MKYFKLDIQYDGTNYCGFQWQKELPTIQDQINSALSKIYHGNFSTMGASRTDKGVHAKHQIVKLTFADDSEFQKMQLETLISDLNQCLPSDIKVRSLAECSGEFRPNIAKHHKEYRYYFTNFKKSFATNELRFISNTSHSLDFEKIQRSLKLLKGEHDFVNFYSMGSNVTSSVRTLYQCELNLVRPQEIFLESDLFIFPETIEECYELKICGNGFLKQMIRHIVSALWMVGSGKITVEEFENYLNGPKINKQLWKVAPPNGLFLFEIC